MSVSRLFLGILNMSISAGWIVLAVLLLRPLLKKAPRWITVLLWGIVAVRCISPFTFESVLSLIPSAQTVSPEIMLERTPSVNTGIPIINDFINPVIGESLAPAPGDSANPLQILIPVMSVVWLVGVAAMLVYTAVSTFRVRRRIGDAVLLRDNVFQSESVGSPFVFGIVRPKIYLPFRIDAQDMEHVIAHERAHILRKDHLWKPFGFLILALHWFNPLLWLGYVLLCRDIELACDEKVIRELDPGKKADYSQALLACSVNRRLIAACPLAFGEVGVKDRVKSVLNYKKPAFWVVICAVLAGIALAVCFLTNPKGGPDAIRDQRSGSELAGLELEIVAVETSAPDPCISVRFKNKTEDELIFGDEHYFYRKTDSGWEDCRNNPNGIWHLVAYSVLPKSSTTHTYGLNGLTKSYALTSATHQTDSASNSTSYILSGNILTQPGEYRFETEFSIDGKAETKYKAWIEFELTRGVDTVSVHTFEPEALVYCDGRYSFVQTAENAPTYRLVNGMQLQEIAADGSVTHLGHMERMTLGEDNFDFRFFDSGSDGFIGQETLAGLMRGNYRAWQLTLSHGDEHLLYLLLEQKDGTFYLGFGYYGTPGEDTHNPDDSHIRWLYRLARVNSSGISESEALPEDNLSLAISRALREHYTAIRPDGLIHAETFTSLYTESVSGTPLAGNTGHMVKAGAYLLVYHATYSVGDDGLDMVDSGFVPTALFFSISEDGEYTLVEYWTPRSGADYEKDIRDMFPESAAENALNTDKYADALKEANLKTAADRYGTLTKDL